MHTSMRMPFGKHKGIDVADVPRQYLEWFLREINGCGEVKDAIRSLLSLPKPKPADGMKLVYLSRGLRSVSGDLSKPIPRWQDGWDAVDDTDPPFDAPHEADAAAVDSEFRAMFQGVS